MDSKSGASILHLFLSWFETDLELIVSENNLVLASAEAWRALCGAGVPPPMPLSHLSKNLEMSVIRHRLKAICLWTKCHLILSSRVQPSPSLPPWGPPPSTRHCFPRPDTQPMSSVSRASLLHMMLWPERPPPSHLSKSCCPPVPCSLSLLAQALLLQNLK